jgi:uncharacterized protein
MGLAGLLGGTAGAVVRLNTPQSTFLHRVLASAGGGADLRHKRSGFALAGTRESDPRNGAPGRSARRAAALLYCHRRGLSLHWLLRRRRRLLALRLPGSERNQRPQSGFDHPAKGIAFLMFVVDGRVVWRYCLLGMVVYAIAGYSSASLARHAPQRVLRGTVIAIGLGMAVWFLWKNN